MASSVDRTLHAISRIESLSSQCEHVLLSVRNGEPLQPEEEKAFNAAHEAVQRSLALPPQTGIVKIRLEKLKLVTYQILNNYNVKANSKKLDRFIKIIKTFNRFEGSAEAIFKNLKSKIVLAADKKTFQKMVDFLQSGARLSTLLGILKSRWNSLQSDVLAIKREFARASERTDTALAVEDKLKAAKKRAEEILEDLKHGNKTSQQIEKELKPILQSVQAYSHFSYTNGFLKEEWTALQSIADRIQYTLPPSKAHLIYPSDFGIDAEEDGGCPYQALPEYK